MSAISRRVVTSIFCFWFACASTLGAIAHAQATASDFEAPIIEHDEVISGVLGDTEVFAATVIDNEELDSVSLFYRYAGDIEFTEIPMQPLVESAYYSASVDTTGRTNGDTAIEYYIRASDNAGNVVLKGLSFDPLVRSLVDPSAASPDAITASEPNPAPAAAPKKKINWLYVGLGALLVGGIAAAAGGGGDSDDVGSLSDPVGGCNPSCTVTLTLDMP